MSRYAVKRVANTLCGEGSRAGSRTVRVDFAGCNLWDGHPLHRDEGAGPCAHWCDADFYKGKVLSLDDLMASMNAAWGMNLDEIAAGKRRWCLLSGGEPLLQVDEALVEALHGSGWRIAVETNGTLLPMGGHPVRIGELFDHVCVSPKCSTEIAILEAHELKVVLPGAEPGRKGWEDDHLLKLAGIGCYDRLYVQPQDPVLDPDIVQLTYLHRTQEVDADTETVATALYSAHVDRCIAFVNDHPEWRLSVQVGKLVGIL